mmetsp:Transcript_1242/g.1317  ORF Transcript_1242/g.1317 Transcript_1242/m.1317 type:complete len:459 (+) Transcript_1242:795-2171(+)
MYEERIRHTMYGKIREDVKALCDKGDIDTIYVTGHSLGGALATLTSFFLACDMNFSPITKREKEKISCIAFADPCVGNVGFQRAMAALAHYEEIDERTGLWQYNDPTTNRRQPIMMDEAVPLRQDEAGHDHTNSHCTLNYIRFQNDRDAVPLSFPFLGYRHTGIKVHLRKSLRGSPGSKYYIYRDHPVMNDSATSIWNFFYNMASPFIGLLLTTLPAVFLVLFTIVRSIIKVALSVSYNGYLSTTVFPLHMDPMVTTSMFATLAVAIVLQISMGLIRWCKGEQEMSMIFLGISNQIIIACIGIGLLFFPLVPEVSYFYITGPDSTFNFKCLVATAVFYGMICTFWFVTMPMTDNNWKRTLCILFLIAAIPFMLEGILYLVNDEFYAQSIEYGTMGIWLGLILLQILMLVRAPWDVYSARTHSLRDYYDNLSPHHQSLSRSKNIIAKAPTNNRYSLRYC